MKQCTRCGGLPHEGGACRYGDGLTTWSHKDEWRKFGKDFLVVVTRHAVEPAPYLREGQHRWAVYAYVYPAHPTFKDYKGDDMWQDAANALPLHAGPSFLEWHMRKDGTPGSVQVGADYHHSRDERFTHYATPDDAWEVFGDAERLFQHLSVTPQP